MNKDTILSRTLTRMYDGVLGNLAWFVLLGLVAVLLSVPPSMAKLSPDTQLCVWAAACGAVAAFLLSAIAQRLLQPMSIRPHDLLRRFSFCWKKGRDLGVEGIQRYDAAKKQLCGEKAQIASPQVSRRRVRVTRNTGGGRVRVEPLDGKGGRVFGSKLASEKLLVVVSFRFRAIDGNHRVDVFLRDENDKVMLGSWERQVSEGDAERITATFVSGERGKDISRFIVCIDEWGEDTPSTFEISRLQLCVLDSQAVFH